MGESAKDILQELHVEIGQHFEEAEGMEGERVAYSHVMSLIEKRLETASDIDPNKLQSDILYLHADIDNLRKQKEREVESATARAVSDCVSRLLPVLDNLERAMNYFKELPPDIREGMDMVSKSVQDSFAELGVIEIAVDGKFDPNLHEAVETRKKRGVKPGMVLETHLKGYKLGERVIRPAVVAVSK